MIFGRLFGIATPVYIAAAIVCLALVGPHLVRAIIGSESDGAPTTSTLLYHDFENGEIPFAETLVPNSTPTVIRADPDQNQFLRMTVSPSDCGASYNTDCPKNRAELFAGAGPTHNQIATYSFAMRIP